MGTDPHNYAAFLLRLWREPGPEPWRASLEDPHTGERLYFAEPQRLLAFLSRLVSDAAPSADRPPPAEPGPTAPAA